MPSENNKTRIYIWNPMTERTGKISRYKTCGHVAVKTDDPDAYYSLWPIFPKEQGDGFFSGIPFTFQESYEDDCDADKGEGRPADVIICLYTLDGDEIAEKSDQILQNKFIGWSAKGTTKEASCASFARQILEAGGFGELASLGFSSSLKKYSSITPGDMRKLAISAKKQELTKHPETKDFECPGETPIKTEDTVKSENTGGCLMM